MIGRNNQPQNPKHVVYFYTEANPAFGRWLKEDIKKYGLQLEPNYRPWDKPVGGSDNGSFAKAGIPIIGIIPTVIPITISLLTMQTV